MLIANPEFKSACISRNRSPGSRPTAISPVPSASRSALNLRVQPLARSPAVDTSQSEKRYVLAQHIADPAREAQAARSKIPPAQQTMRRAGQRGRESF